MSFYTRLFIGIPLFGFALLLGLLWQGLGRDPTLLPSVLLNQPLPPFKAPLLTEPERQVTEADLHGQIALLNVWATWCPSCYLEHDWLRQLAQQGVIIYGLNYKDMPEKALRWLAQFGNPYRFVIDDAEGQIGIDLGVYGAPETYLLDAQGIIRHRHVGELNNEIWQREFLPRIRQLH